MPTRRSPGAPTQARRRAAREAPARGRPRWSGLLSPDLDALSVGSAAGGGPAVAPPGTGAPQPALPGRLHALPARTRVAGLRRLVRARRGARPRARRDGALRARARPRLVEAARAAGGPVLRSCARAALASSWRRAHAHRQRVIVCFFADDRQADLDGCGLGKAPRPAPDAYSCSESSLWSSAWSRSCGPSPTSSRWQLADEAFCSGFRASGELEAWTRQMREAVRELDPDRPITLGAATPRRSSGRRASTPAPRSRPASSPWRTRPRRTVRTRHRVPSRVVRRPTSTRSCSACAARRARRRRRSRSVLLTLDNSAPRRPRRCA